MTPAGLPHSEIPGSKPACGSPRLIAAYHVLHRLSAPRHPPCTLSSLTMKLEYLSIRRILSLLTRFSCQRTLDRSGSTLRLAARRPSIRATRLRRSIPLDHAGGADRVRTDDLLPCKAGALPAELQPPFGPRPERSAMVGLGRFELPTSRLSGVRSNQLSYRPRAQSGRRRRFPEN